MRNAFVKGLLEQMEKNSNVVLLTADLGWSSFDRIRKLYPKQFVNMGLTEQTMTGVAAGMTKMGKDVFIYSIIPFLLYRTLEQIRNDICYPDLPVKLVGTGAAFAYGEAGPTHQPFEDLRIAAALPNMTVLNPSDPKEVEVFTNKMMDWKHPAFMRLGRSGEPILHDRHKNIVIGKSLKLAEGQDVLIISTGIITKVALEVAESLNSRGEVVEVLEIHTFKPFDDESIANSAFDKKLVITLEDNNGALEERVAKTLLSTGVRAKFMSFRVPDQFTHIAAKPEYLLNSYGISFNNIIGKIRSILK
ncbi:MAG: transketolase family protein [Thermoplasmata archaeon]